MADVKNTNIRFNLDKPVFKTAWDNLQSRNKKEFSSVSLLIATAINDFFERREKTQGAKELKIANVMKK